uniref:HEXXH motif domain-containing protein n=1 Tax=Cyanothece sp. (strain PCC 7425 / ATCC 29141) TaxID=395961 RepID=B8HL07_CYAP4
MKHETPLNPSQIEWERLAEPQTDQYDTFVALNLAKQAGYVRSEVGNSPTFFDGQVALRPDQSLYENNTIQSIAFKDCVPADPNHPNVSIATEFVRLWQPAFKQFQLLMESVTVVNYIRKEEEDFMLRVISGYGSKGFGTMIATMNNPAYFAGTLVHELAHHKLRAFGVQMEQASRIILNSPAQLFHSPVRYDSLRPMSAVLHAQYAFTHISELNIRMINSNMDDEISFESAKESLSVNLPKLEFGLQILNKDAILDDYGDQFFCGLKKWTESIFQRGYAILDRFKIEPQTFIHPLSN